MKLGCWVSGFKSVVLPQTITTGYRPFPVSFICDHMSLSNQLWFFCPFSRECGEHSDWSVGGEAERSWCRHGLILWVPPQILHLIWRERRLQDVLCSLREHSEPPEKRVIINMCMCDHSCLWLQFELPKTKGVCMWVSNHLQIKCVTWNLWLFGMICSQWVYCLQVNSL